MLEGDDGAVFSPFTELCRILVTCGELTSDECSAAMEEFSSFVVEKRRYHAASEQSASGIVDIVIFFLTLAFSHAGLFFVCLN